MWWWLVVWNIKVQVCVKLWLLMQSWVWETFIATANDKDDNDDSNANDDDNNDGDDNDDGDGIDNGNDNDGDGNVVKLMNVMNTCLGIDLKCGKCGDTRKGIGEDWFVFLCICVHCLLKKCRPHPHMASVQVHRIQEPSGQRCQLWTFLVIML